MAAGTGVHVAAHGLSRRATAVKVVHSFSKAAATTAVALLAKRLCWLAVADNAILSSAARKIDLDAKVDMRITGEVDLCKLAGKSVLRRVVWRVRAARGDYEVKVHHSDALIHARGECRAAHVDVADARGLSEVGALSTQIGPSHVAVSKRKADRLSHARHERRWRWRGWRWRGGRRGGGLWWGRWGLWRRRWGRRWFWARRDSRRRR